MATHTIDHDRDTQWKINQDNDTWTLAAHTQLSVNGVPAVWVNSGLSSNTINVNGRIQGIGGEGIGVYDQGNDTTINVGTKGGITAVSGIYSNGLNTTIDNQGDIDANYYGVVAQGDAHIDNSGKISGIYAVTMGSSNAPNAVMASSLKSADFNNLLINHKHGEISGASVGVALNGDGPQKLVNDGSITGGDTAIYVSTDKVHIVNHGTIDGIVSLSDENDVIDTSRGTIDGEVHGNSGNDTYIVSKAHVNIVEETDDGYDMVKSDANHTLAANVEKLLLIGKGDIDGKGNSGDNFLRGNSGDNHLKGLAGEDVLGGGKGNDVLTGGADADTFVFNNGDGKDVVTDFKHGTDGISLFDFHGAATFDDVSAHMTDHGKDLWISYGDDTLVLKGVHVADLDAGDFHFPVVI